MSAPVVDVVVAGGGPAGLATAIRAVQAGLEVVVVEPRVAPVDKACGEGLMPGAVRSLAAIGVVPDGRPFHGIRYLDGEHVAEARFPRGTGLGVRRTTLHEAMSARARELGVRVEQGQVREVRQSAGWVDVDGRRARYLVAADGLHSPTREALGLSRPAARRARARYGLRRHYAVEPWSDLVEVHWAGSHEIYVTPVGDHLVGVAVLGPARTGFDEALAAVPALRDRLRDATVAGSTRGAGPLDQRVAARVSGRVLLVGDAAGYVDALTGEGVRLALEESAAAVDAVLRDDPSSYEVAWSTITARYRHGTRALLAVADRPSLRRRLVPAAERFPSVFERCVGALAG